MKKNLIAIALALFVVLSFNSTFVASAIDGISADQYIPDEAILIMEFV